MINSYFKSEDKNFTLLHKDVFDVLPLFNFEFEMIFADPPYFLSNDGLTVKNGKISSERPEPGSFRPQKNTVGQR